MGKRLSTSSRMDRGCPYRRRLPLGGGASRSQTVAMTLDGIPNIGIWENL